MHVSDLTVDLNCKKVFRQGVEVVLTAREFAILELLVIHRGKLVSRTTIYNHIFDENDDSYSNSVDVHVSHIGFRARINFYSDFAACSFLECLFAPIDFANSHRTVAMSQPEKSEHQHGMASLDSKAGWGKSIARSKR